MKKTLLIGLIILMAVGVYVLVNYPNKNSPYPALLPQNFENTPKKLFCEREAPTAIRRNYYVSPGEWAIEVWGRSHKNLVVGLRKTNPDSWKLFLNTKQGWKEYEKASEEEMKSIEREITFTEEENSFFARCRGQAVIDGRW